jgi:hypothetical protein
VKPGEVPDLLSRYAFGILAMPDSETGKHIDMKFWPEGPFIILRAAIEALQRIDEILSQPGQANVEAGKGGLKTEEDEVLFAHYVSEAWIEITGRAPPRLNEKCVAFVQAAWFSVSPDDPTDRNWSAALRTALNRRKRVMMTPGSRNVHPETKPPPKKAVSFGFLTSQLTPTILHVAGHSGFMRERHELDFTPTTPPRGCRVARHLGIDPREEAAGWKWPGFPKNRSRGPLRFRGPSRLGGLPCSPLDE